ncbi:MAG: alpha/beta fold hydrolase [Planctomycetota bacterium]|jgi:dienelactone hydrolase
MLIRPLAAAAAAAALLIGLSGTAPSIAAAQSPAKKSKPLSKGDMKKFAKALGMWLVYGDEPKLAESEKRTKKLEELKKFEDRNWKGLRAKWNGTTQMKPQDRKATTGLKHLYDAAKWPKNEIIFKEPSRKGRGPMPLVIALHGGGRGVGRGSQAMSGYGGVFANKGCMVFAPTVPGPDYVFAHPMSEQFCLNFVHELSREYPIDFDRIYVVGHSLGGVGAWAFAARMPDRFAATVSGAGNPPGVMDNDYEYLYNTRLFVHHSEKDIQVPPEWNKQAEQHIKALDPQPLDIQFHWYVATDARSHAYPASIPKLYEPWVLKQTRDMYPERVVAMCPIARSKDSHGITDYAGDETAVDNFWIGIRGATPTAKVDATRKGNTITITSHNCAQVAVYVSDEFLDLDKPVKVIVNGTEKFNAVVPRSAEFLANHIAKTDDRGRFFSGEIVVDAN